MRTHRLALVVFCSLAAACVTPGSDGVVPVDGEFDRADNLDQFSSCETTAVLSLVNDPSTDTHRLDEIDLHSRAAGNVITRRDGSDALAGTADDFVFVTLLDLDDVPWVGPVAMDAFLAYGEGHCVGVEDGGSADCALDSVLAWVSDPKTTADELKAADVHSRAATEIVAYRNGADGLAGTADDERFETLSELDGVPQVGPSALEALLAEGARRCGPRAGVLMSPQAYDESHLMLSADEIDAAQHSIDIAMYSFSDGAVLDALERAVARGVSIRFVYESASEHRLDPQGTRSAQLEDLGIEVRWVNKIMHHKFALIDGPRHDVAQARESTLVNSSGNWSYGAATRFDENTVVSHGDARLALLYQREFDLIWDNSRDLVWNEEIPHVASSLVITDEMIAAASGSDAVFTSANFRTYDSASYGPTFSKVSGRYAASDTLVDLIAGATTSIHIASGHMRSRQIADALRAKAERDPTVDIRVYLDGQEYVSEWYWTDEVADYEDCLTDATTAGQTQSCHDSGLHFGYLLGQDGIDVRFKYYAYRWDYSYADQMHHKYMIVDGETVASGSYNYSNNAELDTLENIAIYRRADYPELVDDFQSNFETIWQTSRNGGVYTDLLDEVSHGTGDFPIVFTPMALDWDEITVLKDAIRENCPDINSEAYRTSPGSHKWCDR